MWRGKDLQRKDFYNEDLISDKGLNYYPQGRTATHLNLSWAATQPRPASSHIKFLSRCLVLIPAVVVLSVSDMSSPLLIASRVAYIECSWYVTAATIDSIDPFRIFPLSNSRYACLICKNSPQKAVIGATSLTGKNCEKRRIRCIRLHPEYTGKMEDGLKNDIAVITVISVLSSFEIRVIIYLLFIIARRSRNTSLVQLRTPIVVSSLQSPIALASRDYTDGVYRGLISGWGKTSSESSSSSILKWIAVKILSRKRCLNEYKKDDSGDSYTDSKQICALEKVGVGACQVSFLPYVKLDMSENHGARILIGNERNELRESH